MTSQPTFEGQPCKRCGSTLRHATGSKQCVACKAKDRAAWNKQNRANIKLDEQKAIKERKRKLSYFKRKKYNITIDEYNALHIEQNNICAICKLEQSTTLSIDHCHTTGIIRGLLCSSCNFGLGNFKDSIEHLMSAIEYLKKNPGNS